MQLLFTPRAEEDLNNQIEYGVNRFGERIASKTRLRVMQYLENTIRHFPYTGFYDARLDVYETWIPATPFVVIYLVDRSRDAVIILGLYHHAQDREPRD